MSLFEDLEYYRSNEKTLGGRYSIVVDDSVPIDNILILYKPSDYIEIQYLNKSDFIPAPHVTLEAKYCGIIKVDNFHNIDAEAELTAMLSEQMAAEIDREILSGLRNIPKNRKYLLID